MGVTVLEAGTPGWGASGRNGGFCCLGGAKLGYDVIAERYGTDEMRRFFAVQMEAIDLVKETCASRGIEDDITGGGEIRSEEHTSELQSLMHIPSAVFCLKKKNKKEK